MDLKSFVAESLGQIISGIKEAQNRPNGSNVAAEGYISNHGNLLVGGSSGYFTVVDFDVVVAAEATAGGGSVRVADVEAVADTKQTSQNLSRVKFSVPVRLPAGERLPKSTGNYRAADDFNPYES